MQVRPARFGMVAEDQPGRHHLPHSLRALDKPHRGPGGAKQPLLGGGQWSIDLGITCMWNFISGLLLSPSLDICRNDTTPWVGAVR